MTFGRNFQRARTRRGDTRTDAAKALGVSQQAITKWENGLNTPTVGRLQAVAEYMGITTAEVADMFIAPAEEEAFVAALSGLAAHLTPEEKSRILAIARSYVEAPHRP